MGKQSSATKAYLDGLEVFCGVRQCNRVVPRPFARITFSDRRKNINVGCAMLRRLPGGTGRVKVAYQPVHDEIVILAAGFDEANTYGANTKNGFVACANFLEWLIGRRKGKRPLVSGQYPQELDVEAGVIRIKLNWPQLNI